MNLRNINIRIIRHVMCFYLILVLQSAKCQWNIFHYENIKLDSQSIIPNNAESIDGYLFFDTSFDFKAKVQRRAFNPLVDGNKVWFKVLSDEKQPLKKTLYFNLYTDNLSGILVRIYENENNYAESYVHFNSEGYQLPFEIALKNIKKDVDSLLLFAKNRKEPKFPLFACYPIVKDKTKGSKLLVGEANIYQKKETKKPSEANWFYEITGKNENKITNQPITDIGDNFPLVSYGDFVNYRGGDFNFQFENLESDSLIIQLSTLELLKNIFLKYPYYNKPYLSKNKTITEIENIIKSDLSFQSKIHFLKEIADNFHDAHFYLRIITSKTQNITTPLILKKIGNRIQVVGLRDTSLNSNISLGDRIFSINNNDPEMLVNKLSSNYFGKDEQRNELAVSHLVEREIGASVDNIVFEKSDGTKYRTEIKYNKKFPAPKRFIPEHFGFKKLKNNWSYLKMNKWDRGDWIRFFNLKDTLKEKEGIVFDLRGNPGGFETEVIKIASSFVNSPMLYSSHIYGNVDNEQVFHSIIKPNEFLDLSKLRVIILVDNRTACAAEAFTLFLKEATGAIIIGSSDTAGAYSTVYNFNLPYDLVVSANILSKTSFLEEQRIIENHSIQPDIKVKIDNYQDLYGYEDKVLQEALKMIDRSMSNIN
jgi:C-terminal processing protease CtpA/Prc